MTLSALQPALLWQHFQTLTQIPHPSGHETQLRDHWRAWAQDLGLSTELDAGGNLIIRKPASPGMENRQGVILQAHLDMVSQKNSGHPHDFRTDPLQLRIVDGWVKATGTTLGADNGIGVAAALAVLQDPEACHGPLEVLLTLDEEAGMTGARSLEAGRLQGHLLFNLDTEEWGEVYVGCAGGVDVTVRTRLETAPLPEGWGVHALALTGLRGGHSGCDIHLGRANAIVLMARALRMLQEAMPLQIVTLQGGTVRNAIARESFATVAIPGDRQAIFSQILLETAACFNEEFAGVEPQIALAIQSAEAGEGLSAAATSRVLDLVLALPCGVHRFSHAVPGVVETSCNLGVLQVGAGLLEAILLPRSLIDSGLDEMAGRIEAVTRLAGAQIECANAYPGWQPDLSSLAFKVVMDSCRATFQFEPAIKVIHAGLECGLIGARYPEVQMVSFGPTIRNAHSPDEMVEIATVGQFWKLLKASLAAVPAV